MNKQTISLCMIVKNEEKLLARCLESVKGYVSEMIVVDTGSTDRTIEIAKSFGANVIEHTWKNDFAEARNKALEYATGDWVLQLDADEYFVDGTQEKMMEMVEEHKDKDGILVQITNLVGEGQIGNSHVYTRLVKNQPGIQYVGPIHEQVMLNNKVIVGELTTVRIVHSGYTDEVIKEKGKKERNMALLKKELERNPKSGFHNYNISNEYLQAKQYKKGLEHAQRAYQYGKGSTYESNAILNIVWSLYHLERYEDALKLLGEATSAYKTYTDLVFIEGLVLEKQGRMAEAKAHFSKCIEIGESDKNYFSRRGIGSIIPAEKLAHYSMLERDYDKASQYLSLLSGVNKRNFQYAVQMGRMLKRNLSDKELFDYIENVYSGEAFDKIRQDLYVELGVKEGIMAIPPKEDLGLDIQMKISWFTGDKEKAKELCLKGLSVFRKKMLPLSLVYWMDTKSEEVKEQVVKMDKTAKLMVDWLEGNREVKKLNYDEMIFLTVMRELIDLRHYDVFGKLYELKHVFQPKAKKQLAELLFNCHFDDLALECYVDYLQTNEKDHAIWLKSAELLFVSGKYEDAIMFAEMASQKGSKSFRVIEVIIESLKKLNEYEEVMNVCQRAIERYPNSTYLMETIEEAL